MKTLKNLFDDKTSERIIRIVKAMIKEVFIDMYYQYKETLEINKEIDAANSRVVELSESVNILLPAVSRLYINPVYFYFSPFADDNCGSNYLVKKVLAKLEVLNACGLLALPLEPVQDLLLAHCVISNSETAGDDNNCDIVQKLLVRLRNSPEIEQMVYGGVFADYRFDYPEFGVPHYKLHNNYYKATLTYPVEEVVTDAIGSDPAAPPLAEISTNLPDYLFNELLEKIYPEMKLPAGAPEGPECYEYRVASFVDQKMQSLGQLLKEKMETLGRVVGAGSASGFVGYSVHKLSYGVDRLIKDVDFDLLRYNLDLSDHSHIHPNSIEGEIFNGCFCNLNRSILGFSNVDGVMAINYRGFLSYVLNKEGVMNIVVAGAIPATNKKYWTFAKGMIAVAITERLVALFDQYFSTDEILEAKKENQDDD